MTLTGNDFDMKRLYIR